MRRAPSFTILPFHLLAIAIFGSFLSVKSVHSIPKTTDDGFNASWGYQREFESGDNCIDIATFEKWEMKMDQCGTRIEPALSSSKHGPKVTRISASLDIIARNSSVQQRTESGRATRKMFAALADGSSYEGIHFDPDRSRNFDQFHIGFRDPLTQEEITEPKIINIPTFSRGNLLVAVLPDCSTDPYTLMKDVMPEISMGTPAIEATAICTKYQIGKSYEIMSSIREMSQLCAKLKGEMDFDCHGLSGTLHQIRTLPFVISLSPQHCPVIEKITGKIDLMDRAETFVSTADQDAAKNEPKRIVVTDSAYNPKIASRHNDGLVGDRSCPKEQIVYKIMKDQVTFRYCYEKCVDDFKFTDNQDGTVSCNRNKNDYYEINARISNDICNQGVEYPEEYKSVRYCHDTCDKEFYFEIGSNGHFYCVNDNSKLPDELQVRKQPNN